MLDSSGKLSILTKVTLRNLYSFINVKIKSTITMGSPLVDSWLYATILLENELEKCGTGFLVARPIDDTQGKIFLVTNKHVLHERPEMRQKASRIKLYFNIKNTDGSISGQEITVRLRFQDGSQLWREHFDNDVDVLAFDVTSLLNQFPQIKGKWANYSLFCDDTKLDELDITIGEEVIVVGYPLGLRHRTTNFPLFRSGIIATRIGEELEDEILEPNGTRRRRILRGFLIDGATIPGSSGSPVVLKPNPGRYIRGKGIVMGVPPPILLGIVAETRYAPVRTERGAIPSFAGLGLAYDGETIRETIELFFNET